MVNNENPPLLLPSCSAVSVSATPPMAAYAFRDQRRSESLRKCREVALTFAKGGGSGNHLTQLDDLLRDREFARSVFNLYDQDEHGALDQTDWFETLRINFRSRQFCHVSLECRCDLADFLESLTYLVCQESDVTLESFQRVLTGRGVANRLFKLADGDVDGLISVEEMVDFLIVLSRPKDTEDFSPEQVRLLQQIFQHNLPQDKEVLTLDEFKKIMPAKNSFFVQRTFSIFDRDGNGKITLAEFIDSMYQFSRQDPNEKLVFLFKIYDIDGDGRLQQSEIESVMRACVHESGMELPESDIQALSEALFVEARGINGHDNDIGVDQLKEVFAKHPGLIENMNFSLSSWLLPVCADAKERLAALGPLAAAAESTKACRKQQLQCKEPRSSNYRSAFRHVSNQWQLFLFLAAVVAVNAILFATRALEFTGMRNLDGTRPNGFYMVSRASGRCLLLDSVLIFVLVLRYCITKLRNLGAGSVLPLDNNIYLHKVVGAAIFIFSWIHTVMHVCNFCLNVQPDPLKFVQMNSKFWDVPHYVVEDADETKPNWQKLGYRVPPGCILVACNRTDLSVNFTAAVMCQTCNDSSFPWSSTDWLFTPSPGVFGLIGGLANPTGFALIFVVTVMTACSLPCVRKGGFFQVFYFTHLLYWTFVVLLILHAPTFWMWILPPLLAFSVEKSYRAMSTLAGNGKSVIVEGTTMASRVTKLVIKRPFQFKYSPGDWAFVRVPNIAVYEWHPFTISSAPEERDTFTLHVRGVGEWTNRLYEHFEKEKQLKRRRSMREDAVAMQFKASAGVVARTYSSSAAAVATEAEEKRLEIFIDGPFGAPASNFFRAEHAVFVATGIGVTPFSSILQSIMHRYTEARRTCPSCQHNWSVNPAKDMMSLTKVDFFWINRDQRSFEWFITLLDKLEQEQEAVAETSNDTAKKFLDIHLYFTSALQRTDMRAVALQLAMDILYEKENRDVMTKLKVRTNAGRPNWSRVFPTLRDEGRGKVTVFYCGNPHLAKVLRKKCDDFGFNFRKESF